MAAVQPKPLSALEKLERIQTQNVNEWSRGVPRASRRENTMLEEKNPEYYYLKTRDYVSVIRHTLGMSRISRSRQKDHSLWKHKGRPLYKYLYRTKNAHLAPMVYLGMGLSVAQTDDTFQFNSFFKWAKEKQEKEIAQALRIKQEKEAAMD